MSRFTQSYGPSGAQAKAIAAGQPCDVAFLSTGLDMDTVADAGLVAKQLDESAPQGGIVADSVVAFVVRPGNPKHIHTWKDLTKPGVQIVTPGSVPLRLGEVERARRLRPGAQVGPEQQAGDQVRDEDLQERRRAALVRLERGEPRSSRARATF